MNIQQKWEHYIAPHQQRWSKELQDFANTIILKDTDYDEHTDDYGQEIGIHYVEFEWNGVVMQARHTTGLASDMAYWGLPNEEASEHIDEWMMQNLSVTTENLYDFLDVLLGFHDAK